MNFGRLVGAIAVAAIWSITSAWIQEPAAKRQPGPLVTFVGADSRIATQRFVRVTDKEQWAALWLEHTGQPQPKDGFNWFYNQEHVPEIDFAQCMVVAVFRGTRVNSAGVRVIEILAEAERTLLRFDGKPYQTAGPDGGGERTTPFGLFVLPNRPGPIVLEENVQSMIGKPPRWQERATL